MAKTLAARISTAPVHQIGHVLGLFDIAFDQGGQAAITNMFKPLYTDSTLSQQLYGPTDNSPAGLYRFKSTRSSPQYGVTATFIFGGHVYEGDLYGTNDDPVVAYISNNGAQQVNFETHANDLMNRLDASPSGGPNATGYRETNRQFISDLDVKVLADAYGYSVALPSTLNTAHVMLDIQTGQLLVQGSARNNSTGVGTNDTINLQRVVDGQGDNIFVTVTYSGTTYSERVPFTQVTSIVINGNGGTDSITVNPNVTQPWQQVQYVVSSNEDRLEDSTSVGGSSTTNGIVDVSAVIPGAQTTLRAAIVEANGAGGPRSIYVGRGKYELTLAGTNNGAAQGDFDITGNVTIIGAGAGATVIDAGSLNPVDRFFDVAAGGVLKVDRVTLKLGQAAFQPASERSGGAVRVQDYGQFDWTQSAILGNTTVSTGSGGGIFFAGHGSGSIVESVITVNESSNDMTGGVYLAAPASSPPGVVTVTRSIIAKNQQIAESYYPDVYAAGTRQFTSGGNYRLGNVANGFTDGANGDYILNPNRHVDYIVTSIVDTYDGTSDPLNMSLRDAVHQANITAGTQEIWLRAWKFVLTRERNVAWNHVELDVAWGDIEFDQSTIIRGINSATGAVTRVDWMAGAAVDKVFELVGDYDGNYAVDTIDYDIWRNDPGTSLAADGDDNGTVDGADFDIWRDHYSNTLLVDSILGV